MTTQTQQAQEGGENTRPETVPYEDYENLDKRAKRFEGQLKDTEVKLKEMEKRFENFKDVDIEEVRQIREGRKNKEFQEALQSPEKLKGWYDEQEKKIRSTVNTEVEDLRKTNEKLARENKTLRVTDKVMAEIGRLFNEDTHVFIKMEVEKACDFEDGEIVVKDEDGEVIYSKKNPSLPMKPSEYGELLAERFPSMAKREGVGGTKEAGTKVANRGAPAVENIEQLNSVRNPKEVYKNMSLDQKRKLLQNTPLRKI